MNYLDATVTKILSEPYEPEWKHEFKEKDVWLVDVEYDCYGRLSKTSLGFNSRHEAENLKVGHEFLT